ncbi:hypothetical protein SUGI_0178460 [Cryptomeria japonica]|uniref:anthocyanidin 3-O-glucosyltransferase 2 n=1 Tax=Cryptomeria japonica TaxID=3369 RepID=UPI002408D532|nr:anthocyanidin 3-O-glucosyltransferase 2 [Cryptomeria japonica]GLJ11848.1 hypothetical protein SUGI_0178460 [Cryptomeria japonica]
MEKQQVGCGISRPHVALYPAVGLGHLIPFIELARKLVSSHGFAVTLITPAWNVSPSQTKYVSDLLSSNPNTIRQIELPQIPSDGQDTKDDGNYFLEQISKSMPAVEQNLRILQQSNHPFSPIRALISDLFHVATLNVTDSLGLPNYVLFTSSAAFLYFMLCVPRLYLSEGNEAPPVSVNIPGWKKPFSEGDFPDLFRNKSNPMFHGFLGLCSPLRAMKGILVNTFYDLEAQSIHALLSRSVVEIDRLPPVHAVGPIMRSIDLPQADSEGEESLKLWLDSRANASVVFASFGTWGLMSREQLTEIALGLEASGVNFVWVVRGISITGSGASRFSSSLEVELSSVLPEGFLSRVEGRGLVLPSWAPQVTILSHPAVGAFVSHCGWNSTLEAIWFGVPIVAWPLYAEQRMNCLLIVTEWMVGLEAVKGEDGLVGRAELQSVLEKVMDGEDGRLVRKNMEELSLKARCAVTEKEGSSFVCMEAAFSDLAIAATEIKHND